MCALALSAALLALGSPGSPPPLDEVVLASGRSMLGRVLWEDERIVLLRQGDQLREIDRDGVRALVTLEGRVGEVLDRLGSLETGELDEQVEVALRARELGLDGEAEMLLLRVVLVNPSHERARELLGHKKFGSAWRAPWGNEWLPLTQVASKRMEWAGAWEFDTAHWSLRTNLDLPTALDVALDLEIAWRAFYEVLGEPLGLRRVDGRLSAQVHSDVESLPFLDDRLRGWFDHKDNRLIIDASWRLDRSLLFHEATHQLLHNTHPSLLLGAHRLPRWLDEGLAEFMQVGLSLRTDGFKQVPGRTFDFDWRTWSQHHVDLLVKAPEDARLLEVLAYGPEDFAPDRRSGLAYARAYSLVDFCMNADGGRFQDELFAFLREARERPVGPEDFLALVARGDLETFESDWAAYVREFARDPEAARRRRQRSER